MDDKSLLDFTKPPVDTSPTTSVNRNVTKCCTLRELGFKQKTNVVPNELQWAAEDKMVMRTHEEYRCELPDVSRSTFLMVFSPDGKKVASTHGNHNVYVTDLTSGKNIKTLTGHPRTPWCIAFHPSSNQILASGCLGGQVRVWDLHGGSEIWTAESQTVIASLAFHPVDRMLVIASYNELHFWDWSQPEPFAKCYTANEKEKVRYVAFDQLGHKLITGVANAPARCASQWDRVSAPQPPPQTSQLDSERRITICYRYMVEQYEQLVQRYYDLSRARSTPTIDRGTDPMDLDSESTSRSSDSGRSNITSSSQSLIPTVTRSHVATATTMANVLDSRDVSEVVPTSSPNEATAPSSSSSPPLLQFGNVFLSPRPQADCTQTTPCHTHTFNTPLPQPSLLTARVAAGTDERSASRSSTQFLTDDVSTPAVTPTDSPRMTRINSTDSSENTNWTRPHGGSPVVSRRSVHTSPITTNVLPPTLPTASSENYPDSSNSADNHFRSCENTRSGGSHNYYSRFLFRNCSQPQNIQPTTATSTRCTFSVQNRNRSDSESSAQSNNTSFRELCPESINTGLRRHDTQQNNSNSNGVSNNSNVGNNCSINTNNNNNNNGNNSNNNGSSNDRSRFYGRLNCVRQLVHDLLGSSRRSMSDENTELNSIGSDNDDGEHSPILPNPQPSAQDNERPGSPLNSHQNVSSSDRSRLTPGTASRRAADSVESAPRRVESTSTAVSRLRTQFRRLQSAYHSRSTTHSSHVLSAETQAAERRLLNRLNEILERPLPDPRARRTFSSRRSAFQPRNTTSSSTHTGLARSSISPDIGGVRYGIQLLSRHIDNMQRLCREYLCSRARYSYVVEILQFQQIRRMWEDLQSQIYALHGAVRDGNGEGGGGVTNSRGEAGAVRHDTTSGSASGGSVSDGGNTDIRSSGRNRSDSRSESESGDTQERGTSNMLDLLTDDDSDGPSSSGNVLLRPTPGARRTIPPFSFRRYKMFLQRNPRLVLKRPRTSAGVSRAGECSRRLSYLQTPVSSRRQPSARTTSSGQATTSEDQISERGEASSSHVSGETSTGTSERERDRRSVRGVKRKSKDSDPLFRPRPPSSNPTGAGTSSSSSQQPYNLAMSMRETIMQLESMVWRHRERNAQRNVRMSRFTRQREERMMRNLWDTESSHESSRDDQSEGDSSQQSSSVGQEPGDAEWSRESTRLRARQVLLLMVDSLTQFFENDSLSRRTSNEALLDRIHNLYVLLQLALNLTDLLLAQLVSSRRELETRRPSSLPTYLGATSNATGIDTSDPWTSRYSSRSRHIVRNLGRSETWRRTLRFTAPNDTSQSTPTNNSDPGDAPNRRNVSTANTSGGGGGGSSRGFPPRHHSVYSNIRNAMLSHHRMTVPVVRVNDLPAPSLESSPPPRPRPHSPPPFPIGGGFASRFLYPRYTGPNPFDESTSEDSSPQDRSDNFIFMRGYGPGSVILSDTPVSPHHRIQAWDFSNYNIPDISNAEKNVVVSECKIHNDASVDMSVDGQLLVTLLPSGRLSSTTMLGIYSLQWDTLGQLLYTTSFEQNAVSVSLSPTTRHLVVGLASRRAGLVNTDRHTNAQIFRLEGASPGRKSPLGPRGRLVHLRDLELNRHLSFMSLNCIRWTPNPGQGLVYGTNTGHLKILR